MPRKLSLEHNDSWALTNANELRGQLSWDSSIPLKDLSLQELDVLIGDLFSRVVKWTTMVLALALC